MLICHRFDTNRSLIPESSFHDLEQEWRGEGVKAKLEESIGASNHLTMILTQNLFTILQKPAFGKLSLKTPRASLRSDIINEPRKAVYLHLMLRFAQGLAVTPLEAYGIGWRACRFLLTARWATRHEPSQSTHRLGPFPSKFYDQVQIE